MTPLDELVALRPLVSQLRHDLEHERRERSRLQQRYDAEAAMVAQLRAQLVALREAQRNDRTPAMGSISVESDHG